MTSVVMGAVTQCSFGAAPSTLNVLPLNKVVGSTMPMATIMDNKPMVNIMPFGMCMSPSNPMVAAATIAALGVLTPMPCVPVTPAPWLPAIPPTIMINNQPALTDTSTCMCTWGGVIKVNFPGQVAVQD